MQILNIFYVVNDILTRLTNALVLCTVLRSDQRNGTSSTLRTDLRPARIDATAAFAILRIHVLFLAVWTTNDITFFLGLCTAIFRVLGVHVYFVTCCNYVYCEKLKNFILLRKNNSNIIKEKKLLAHIYCCTELIYDKAR